MIIVRKVGKLKNKMKYSLFTKFLRNAATLRVRNLSANYSTDLGIKYLPRANGNKVAYRQITSDDPDAPGIILFSGFQSNMQGVKAIALERYCATNNLPFIRFDYQGCGDSTGDLRELTVTDWRSDSLAILDQLTAGPQILVGSSMGGLLMLHAAMVRPNRVKALVGIATAADMPERMFKNYMGDTIKTAEETGEAVYNSDQNQYIITRNLLQDLPNHSILSRDHIPITCPVRLLHGMKDDSVPYLTSLELAKKLQSRSVNTHFRKNGDHRFCQPEDIQLLFEILNCLVFGTEAVRDLALKSYEAFSQYTYVKDKNVRDKDVVTRTVSRVR